MSVLQVKVVPAARERCVRLYNEANAIYYGSWPAAVAAGYVGADAVALVTIYHAAARSQSLAHARRYKTFGATMLRSALPGQRSIRWAHRY